MQSRLPTTESNVKQGGGPDRPLFLAPLPIGCGKARFSSGFLCFSQNDGTSKRERHGAINRKRKEIRETQRPLGRDLGAPGGSATGALLGGPLTAPTVWEGGPRQAGCHIESHHLRMPAIVGQLSTWRVHLGLSRFSLSPPQCESSQPARASSLGWSTHSQAPGQPAGTEMDAQLALN